MKPRSNLKISSLVSIFLISLQKYGDILHSFLFGIPVLKRAQITANLYLGSQYSEIGIKKLKALGITAIVNMRMHSVYEEAIYEHMKYLHLPTVDNTTPPQDVLIEGSNFIDKEIKAGGKVYIHCRQGLGRGPTMTIAYLIKIGITFDDAYALVKRIRPFIKPTQGQIDGLKAFQNHYNLLAI